MDPNPTEDASVLSDRYRKSSSLVRRACVPALLPGQGSEDDEPDPTQLAAGGGCKMGDPKCKGGCRNVYYTRRLLRQLAVSTEGNHFVMFGAPSGTHATTAHPPAHAYRRMCASTHTRQRIRPGGSQSGAEVSTKQKPVATRSENHGCAV
jgi:hypothetical protein